MIKFFIILPIVFTNLISLLPEKEVIIPERTIVFEAEITAINAPIQGFKPIMWADEKPKCKIEIEDRITTCGYFDKEKDSQENREVLAKVNAHSPDILIVGFGIPAQEKWLLENVPQLSAGVFLATGAMFDYISGEMPRSPSWMTNRGFEWLGRLFAEPGRLWRRYLLGLPVFFIRVLRQKFGLLPHKLPSNGLTK